MLTLIGLNTGGWSARGAVVDAMHHRFREKLDEADIDTVGMCANLRNRKSYEELTIRPSGAVHMEIDVKELLNKTFGVWKCLDNKIFAAAWVAVGLFDRSHFPCLADASIKDYVDPSGFQNLSGRLRGLSVV